VILVDGSNLLHRGLHTSQADLKDSKGQYTGGIHSFLSSLSTAVFRYELKRQIVVAWDLGVPLFRRQIYREYKPNKNPIGNVPNNLKSEQNLLAKEGEGTADEFLAKYTSSRRLLHHQFLPLSGCLSISVENCEADDIIAYICNKITDEDITIYSTDRDLMQLMTNRIQFYNGIDSTTSTVDSLIQEHDLVKDYWRSHWLTIRAIAGDSSDGIPGFTGFDTAKKYAAQLMELQYTKNYTLYNALIKLERPPGARVVGYEALKAGNGDLLRNLRLMDLRYPIEKHLPIINDISSEIARSFLFDIDQNTLEEQLHNMDLRMAKTFIENIITSNRNNDIREYIRKLV
jgi:5'-3' exonuclease